MIYARHIIIKPKSETNICSWKHDEISKKIKNKYLFLKFKNAKQKNAKDRIYGEICLHKTSSKATAWVAKIKEIRSDGKFDIFWDINKKSIIELKVYKIILNKPVYNVLYLKKISSNANTDINAGLNK